MHRRSLTAFLLCLLSASPSLAAGQDDTRPAELIYYDQELNKTYNAIIQQLGAAKQKQLKIAQRAWLQMRDSDCEWAFVDKRDCLIDRTINRTTELKQTPFQSKSGKFSSIEAGGKE